MKPEHICKHLLGPEGIEEALTQLTSGQLRSIIRDGGLPSKIPPSIVSKKKKREMIVNRIKDAVSRQSEAVASGLLVQWLLNHRREMLVAFLEKLGVEHDRGETNDRFLHSKTKEAVVFAANELLSAFPKREVCTYLAFIADQQESDVFVDWEPLKVELAQT